MHAPVPGLRTYPVTEDWARLDRALPAAGAASFLLFLAVAWLALRDFANSADEYGFLFEARTFLAGRLWNAAAPPPLDRFLEVTHIFALDGKWVSQYPPGWPLVLAGVKALGLPFMVAGPLLGAACVVALGCFEQRVHGRRAALVAMALAATAPFFVFNAASYFSHTLAALALVLFVWAGHVLLETPRPLAAVALGAALGVLGTTRYFDAVLGVLPFAVAFLWRARRAHWRVVPWAALGVAPFLAGLLWYNWRITGDPLLNVTSWGYPFIRLGLWGYGIDGQHSPERALAEAWDRLIELAGWTSPILLALWGAAVADAARRRRLAFWDFMLPVFVLGFMLYPDEAGNRYGPRYWFDGFPFMVVTIAGFIAARLDSADRRGRLVVTLGALHLALALALLPVFALRERAVVDGRLDLYEAVERAGLRGAVVIVRSGTGEIRPMEPWDLLRNGIDLDGEVIYAREREEHALDELFAALPGRAFWVYERAEAARHGVLRRYP